MKLMHLADLHLGKRVNGFSMLEDQRFILDEILSIDRREEPRAVLIAGDVYDRPVPPEEAVTLFDGFLCRLAERGRQVFLISGNHDSAERVAFGSRLMDRSGIHFAPVYDGAIAPHTLSDEHGSVNFWLIPFLKPAHVRRFAPDRTIETYTDAMAAVVGSLALNEKERNVVLAHQFVTGGKRSDSEERSVGGLDEIAGEVFDPFDYAALGHLHAPQSILRPTLRYAGSPLKYSFSESTQQKAVTLAELGPKGEVAIRTEALTPRRDLVRLAGPFEALLAGPGREDYCELTLTDEEDVPNALTRLREIYPNLMVLRYDNTRTRSRAEILEGGDAENRSPLELFEELYLRQNGASLSPEQRGYLTALIEELWGGEE